MKKRNLVLIGTLGFIAGVILSNNIIKIKNSTMEKLNSLLEDEEQEE